MLIRHRSSSVADFDISSVFGSNWPTHLQFIPLCTQSIYCTVQIAVNWCLSVCLSVMCPLTDVQFVFSMLIMINGLDDRMALLLEIQLILIHHDREKTAPLNMSK